MYLYFEQSTIHEHYKLDRDPSVGTFRRLQVYIPTRVALIRFKSYDWVLQKRH